MVASLAITQVRLKDRRSPTEVSPVPPGLLFGRRLSDPGLRLEAESRSSEPSLLFEVYLSDFGLQLVRKMCGPLLIATLVLAPSTGVASAKHTYSQAVQQACANDYKRHCGQYGIETEALRLCMDRAGQRLTKTCVDALVADGEVSKQEVERRKRSGR